jgi:hypothetical protein
MKKLNKDIFIQKSNEYHNNKFDYKLVDYKNLRTKVKIICPSCGVFEQSPDSHMRGFGCSKCNIQTKDTFINKALKKHNNRYSYDDVYFINNTTKVNIICEEHGTFQQTPQHHLRGSGCMKCFRNNKLSNTDKFIEKSNIRHNNLYSYTLVKYKNNKEKVSIICEKHGVFEQEPNHHLNGCGCPFCNISKGELEIESYLIENNIDYISQKTFDGCFSKSLLRFDFYLPSKNTCIEYNGLQHYKVVEYFGGIDSFIEGQKRDIIKEQYCSDNKIKLIIIKYSDNIRENLMTLLKK